METSAAGSGFQPNASLAELLLRQPRVGCWARSTSAGSEVTDVGHGCVSLAKIISFQKFQMEGLGSGWPFLWRALAPPAWLGRAGPLPRGRAAGHRSPAAFTFGWPSPAPLSQALTTSAPGVPSPRTGSSKAGSPWRLGSSPVATADRPVRGGARPVAPKGTPQKADGCCFRACQLPAWEVRGEASASWGPGVGSLSVCPRRAWPRPLSLDCRVLAGSWGGLQPKPGTADRKEAGGLVPDLEWGGADCEGCV